MDHNIKVSLDPVSNTLRAFQVIRYTNNSPDVLKEIWFHAWPNAFANRHTPFAEECLINGNKKFFHASESEYGFLDSLDFRVDGVACTVINENGNAEILKVTLPRPLGSGETIEISTPFRVKIPQLFSRLGHAGNLYSITQWYPKPAVYDVNGWNTFSYQAQGEFYSEFGSYQVQISLPDNFRVGATGVLQEKEEMDWMTHLTESDDDGDRTGNKAKTLTFIQDNVLDFAWFACPDFNVAKGSSSLPNGKTVVTWAMYKNDQILKGKRSQVVDGKSMLDATDKALNYYSKRVGNYPYDYCTVVVGPLEGAGGMEYPMITICASADEGTIIHEVGHNWFQGMLGSNERMHPWMDESINTFYHSQASGKGMEKFSPGDRIKAGGNIFNFRLAHDLALLQSGTLRSEQYQQTNYGTIVYGANPLRFMYLQEYLSRDIFDSCMKYYFRQWQFKHPLPSDIQAAFEAVSKQDLDWFFNGLLAKGAPDYSIASVKRSKAGFRVKVNSKSGPETPLRLDYQLGTNVKGMWLSGRDTVVEIPSQALKVVLNPSGYLSESNLANNQANTLGIFKTWGKTVLRLPYLMKRGENRVWIFPNIISANSYDGYMPGIILSNFSFPRRNWEWWVTPMYGLKSKTITGFGKIQRNFFPKKGAVAGIEIFVKTARFSFSPEESKDPNAYNRITPGFDLYFRRNQPYVQNRLEVDLSINRVDHLSYLGDTFANNIPIGEKVYPYDPNLENEIFRVAFVSEVYRKLQPAKYTVQFEHGNGLFGKLSAAAEIYFHYPNRVKKDIGLRVLGFMNTFVYRTKAEQGIFDIPISGANGNNDYSYRNTMFHRNTGFREHGFWGQQLLYTANGVRMPLRIHTENYLVGLNVQSHIVPILPLMLFADGAMAQVGPGKSEFFYAAGITYWGHLDLNTRFEINLPFLYSEKYKQWVDLNDVKWYELITFKIGLDILSPMKSIRYLYK